jgi:NDP-sugar pyrophosphorylase family protein
MKLIILAAGKGTRFKPLTDTIPKGMVPILGEPLLKHVIAPYLNFIDEIIIVVNADLGLKVRDYFKENYQGHKVFYKIQLEQKGTMDALMACKDMITSDELFCVCNGDDLVKSVDVENAIKENKIGLGISKKIMPKNYLGIEVKDSNISGFNRHNIEDEYVEDVFCNGFGIFDKRIFEFEGVSTMDGELGLPHTLFANLATYPLKAFNFKSWETVNRPSDIKNAEEFLKN